MSSKAAKKEEGWPTKRVRWFGTCMIPLKYDLVTKWKWTCDRKGCSATPKYTIYRNSNLSYYLVKTLQKIKNTPGLDLGVALCSKNCLEALVMAGILNGQVPVKFGVKIKNLDKISELLRNGSIHTSR